MSTIEVINVSKDYGSVRALDAVSFTLAQEGIYGLLGRNGAGKTTLISIITNRVFAGSGSVLIDGEPANENDRVQPRVCCMSGKVPHPGEMRVADGLKWSREFYRDFDLEYARDLAQKFGLPLDKRLNGLSTGYSSIFTLIVTLASGAPVIMFDEPVLGVDANYRELFYRELLAHYGEHPQTIVLSTHLIDEVAEFLDRVLVLKEGRLILDESADTMLRESYSVSGAREVVDRYSAGKNVIREESIGRLKVSTIKQERTGEDDRSIEELGLEVSKRRLQEIIVGLTNSKEK
jgi:ABC-2 type transport system ATP-binding protein